MVKPLPRQQVFHLTEDEQQTVDQLIIQLNLDLERGMGGPRRLSSQLLVLGRVVEERVLNEVAYRCRAAGYDVEIVATDSPAMLRIK